MSFIPDEKLFSHASRVKDAVVLITGGGSGIGKKTALDFAQHGAKVVIGDIDLESAEATVNEIKANGGSAIALRCDVRSWDEQASLFERAVEEFGSVDVVVPNAGISEAGHFHIPKLGEGGKPVKPKNLKTIDINLTGALYTIHLALHYLQTPPATPKLKALILIGSMASWSAIPFAPLYSGSKHAMLGIMRSLFMTLPSHVRVGCIHPFFADTNILRVPVKLLLAGVPMTKVDRVAGAIFFAATDTNPETNGSSWLLLDDGEVFLVPREEFRLGVYGMIDARANSLKSTVRTVGYWFKFFRDVNRALGGALVKISASAVVAGVAWNYRDSIRSIVESAIH